MQHVYAKTFLFSTYVINIIPSPTLALAYSNQFLSLFIN